MKFVKARVARNNSHWYCMSQNFATENFVNRCQNKESEILANKILQERLSLKSQEYSLAS